MDAKLSAEVWRRLKSSSSMSGLGLSRVDERFDLTGIRAPEPPLVREHPVSRWAASVRELTGLTVLRGAKWTHLDFSNTDLRSLRFFGCEIEECRFDKARCQDWSLWDTKITKSSFRSANLRGATLGAVDERGNRNSFVDVDFRDADLSETAFKSADMIRCAFANVARVSFAGTVFVDCIFEGTVDSVLFCRHAPRGEAYPPNEMKGVNFRGAHLRQVGFRGLDLADVRWPRDEEHVIVPDYRAALDRLLQGLQGRPDELARRLTQLIENQRRWAGPDQRVGIVSKSDLLAVGGESALREFMRLVGTR